jgi:hypothetical protein
MAQPELDMDAALNALDGAMGDSPPGVDDALSALDSAMGDDEQPPVSFPKAALMGAAQGASAGFADELTAAAKSIGVEPLQLLGAIATAPMGGLGAYLTSRLGVSLAKKGAGGVADDYRTARDEERAGYKRAEDQHGGAYLAGQIGGGLATVLLPGGAPATLGKMAKSGVAYGMATGLGDSDADLTRGEILEAGKDTAIGGAIGGVSGVTAGLVGKGVKAVYNAARGRRGVAKLAEEVAESAGEAIPVQGQPSPRSFYEKSVEIAKDAGDIFSPAEATGDSALALAESKALQLPKTMRTAQAQRAARLQNTARYLDGLTDSVASDPTKLGRAEVAETFAGAVERHLQSLKATRSAAAKPLYDKADRLLGSKAVAPIDEVASFVSTELERSVGPFQVSAAPLKQTLEALQKGSDNGFASIRTVRALAEKWGQQADGTGDLLKDLPIAQRKYIASKMSELLNRSIDAAAESGQKTDAGIQALREAQRTWASHSQAIEELPLEALNRVLKVGGGEAGDTLVERMMTLSPEQLGGVMRAANKTDPAVAQQLRSQVMESLLVRAGKPERGASIAAEIGATELRAGTALQLFGKNEAKLRALYAGDDKAMFALRRVMETLKRKATTPGLRGSQTTPLIAQVLEESADAAASAAVPGGGKVTSLLKSMLGTDKAIAAAVTDPAKLQLLDQALQIKLGMAEGTKVPDTAIRALMTTASRLGLSLAEQVRTPLADKNGPRPYYAGGKQ